MTVNNIKTIQELQALSKSELRNFIFFIQSAIQKKLSRGQTMDEILDAEDPFELIEPVLPREVYPIFVLAIINDIKTDTVMDTILDALEDGLSRYGNDIGNNGFRPS